MLSYESSRFIRFGLQGARSSVCVTTEPRADHVPSESGARRNQRQAVKLPRAFARLFAAPAAGAAPAAPS